MQQPTNGRKSTPRNILTPSMEGIRFPHEFNQINIFFAYTSGLRCLL
jgi:hypothetical protein